MPPSPPFALLIQARLGSARLPGKALLPLPFGGHTTLLGHVLRRAGQAGGRVIVATTDQPEDDPLAAHAAGLGAGVFRGDAADVLGRLHGAAWALAPDCPTLVRLTADNPAIEPATLRAALAHHHGRGADYTLTTGLPLGCNVEVVSAAGLARAYREARAPEEREHVTPYLRRHPELFRLETLALEVPPAVAALRLTVDYPTDYALLSLLLGALGPDFTLAELPPSLAAHPWLAGLNAGNAQLAP